MVDAETIQLGGRTFEVEALPWGKLKPLAAVLYRVGLALSLDHDDESTLDDVTLALSLGLGLSIKEVEALPANLHEVGSALRALLRVSGIQQELDYQQLELTRRQLEEQRLAPAPPVPGAH